MIYEHTMMFRLTTPPANIDLVLDAARTICAQKLRNVEAEKRRTRIRELGTHTVKVVSFEVEGDADMMERLRERLWEDHDDIISTLTIPHPQHERQTRYAPRRWEAAVDEWSTPGEDRPAYGGPAVLPTFSPASIPAPEAAPLPERLGADRFSKDALMERYNRNLDKKERRFTRPLPR